MIPIIEVVTLRHDNGGAVNRLVDEHLAGIEIREVKLFGLKVLTITEAMFVTEVRCLGILLKRSRLKEWEIYLHP